MAVLRNVLVCFLLLEVYISEVSCTFFNVGVKYKVTMDMYSGRDNPEWEIDEKSPVFNDITQSLNKGPPSGMFTGLGYRGFTVQANNAMGQQAWKTIGRRTDRALESLLLESCPKGQLSPAAMQHVSSGILGHVHTPPVKVAPVQQQQQYSVSIEGGEDDSITIRHNINVFGRKKRQANGGGTCSTSFMPENWNYAPVQRRNNCYNYATNRQTNTFAQPGRASGMRYQRTTARDVYAATIRDGLTPLTSPNAGRGCLIALIIWPGEDYHFLRLDNDGYWSQKSGRTRARNTDDSGNLIRDPRRSDNGPYRVFAGWLGVTELAVVR